MNYILKNVAQNPVQYTRVTGLCTVLALTAVATHGMAPSVPIWLTYVFLITACGGLITVGLTRQILCEKENDRIRSLSEGKCVICVEALRAGKNAPNPATTTRKGHKGGTDLNLCDQCASKLDTCMAHIDFFVRYQRASHKHNHD